MKQLKEIAEWFIAAKAPDLKEKINEGLKIIESGQPLDSKHKKLFGFMLFSHSMNYGPLYFLTVEEIAKQISVTEELKDYANDWINHSNQTRGGK